jgi:hypothetical protein
MNTETLRSLGLSTTARSNDPMQSGADGFVVPISGRPYDIAKIFPSTKPSQTVLEQIGDILLCAKPGDRAILEDCFALPKTLLLDDSSLVPHCVGFTMKAAGDPFFHTSHVFGQNKRFLLEYDHLIGRNANGQLGLPSVSQADTLEIVSLTLRVYSILHFYGFIIQDISNRNATWSVLGGPQVLVLDADSIRSVTGPSAVPPKHSPGYTPTTWGPKNQTQESDVYKASLLVGRALSGDALWPNGNNVLLGQTALDAAFRRASTDAPITNRPTMAELLDAVEHWDRPPATAWINLGLFSNKPAQPTAVSLFPCAGQAAPVPGTITTAPPKSGFIPLTTSVAAPVLQTQLPVTPTTNAVLPRRRAKTVFVPLLGSPSRTGSPKPAQAAPAGRTPRQIRIANPALTGAIVAALLIIIPALLTVLTR